MSLLAFGEALIDFLSQGGEPETFARYAGGAPANVAVAYAKLGGRSAFAGMLGRDMFGDFLLTELGRHGVDTRYCRQTDRAKTALAFVSLDERGERSFSFYRPPAADLLFTEGDFVERAFEEAQIFHVCSNSLTEAPIAGVTMAGMQRAAQHGCVRSVDVNLRLNLWSDTTELVTRIDALLAEADVVKVSAEEREVLCERAGVSADDWVHRRLAEGVRLVVLTQGGGPVHYWTAKHRGEQAIPRAHVVDTTAAGDAFTGGLLWAMADASLDQLVEDEAALGGALAFAVACGAVAVSTFGAFPSLPDLQQAMARVES